MELSYLMKYFDAFRRVNDDDVAEGSTHREHKQRSSGGGSSQAPSPVLFAGQG